MKDITNKEFDLLRKYIKDNYGISLNDEKKSLLFARLRPVLQQNNFDSFMDYFEFLKSDKTGEAIITFVDKITTNHTFFMREVDHFYYFRDTVLPYIEQSDKNKDIRVWSAGCSSGEEPYTLQMLIQDHFNKKDGWNKQILATDISTNVLSKAESGIYSNDQIKTLPDNWKRSYLKKHSDDSSVFVDTVRNEIIYRKFNLMESKFPFKKKFQTIFCRNVMIYYENETRDQLVNKFYDATEEGGYLFIGHSETLNYSQTKYKYIMPAVYRKI